MQAITNSVVSSFGREQLGRSRESTHGARASQPLAEAKGSANFTFVTAEGDKVTLSADSLLQASYPSYNAHGALQGSKTHAPSDALSFTSTQHSAVTVQGDLNQQELQDIQQVIERVVKIAGEVYGGTLQGSVDEALGFNDFATLQSFNATLEYSQSLLLPLPPARDNDIVALPDSPPAPVQELPPPVVDTPQQTDNPPAPVQELPPPVIDTPQQTDNPPIPAPQDAPQGPETPQDASPTPANPPAPQSEPPVAVLTAPPQPSETFHVTLNADKGAPSTHFVALRNVFDPTQRLLEALKQADAAQANTTPADSPKAAASGNAAAQPAVQPESPTVAQDTAQPGDAQPAPGSSPQSFRLSLSASNGRPAATDTPSTLESDAFFPDPSSPSLTGAPSALVPRAFPDPSSPSLAAGLIPSANTADQTQPAGVFGTPVQVFDAVKQAVNLNKDQGTTAQKTSGALQSLADILSARIESTLPGQADALSRLTSHFLQRLRDPDTAAASQAPTPPTTSEASTTRAA